MMGALEGRVAATGGESRGTGSAIVKRFAEDRVDAPLAAYPRSLAARHIHGTGIADDGGGAKAYH